MVTPRLLLSHFWVQFSMYWRVRGIVLLRWLLVWCPHYYTLLGTFWYVVTAAYPAQIYPFACADRAADAGALNLLQVSFRVILDHMEMILRDLRLFWDYDMLTIRWNTLKIEVIIYPYVSSIQLWRDFFVSLATMVYFFDGSFHGVFFVGHC